MKDLWREQNWHLNSQYTLVPMEISELIEDTTPTFVENMLDLWLWNHSARGRYVFV